MPHKDSLPLAAQKGRNSKTFVYSCSNSTIIVGTEPVTTLPKTYKRRLTLTAKSPLSLSRIWLALIPNSSHRSSRRRRGSPIPSRRRLLTPPHPPPSTNHPRATGTQKTEEPEGNRNAQPANRQSRAAAHTAVIAMVQLRRAHR
ncbi:hypothetical protein B0H19DRAFT_1242001 [Mycena capillaripes]|nr:hypothetical protein B0H19DRAFT_1242001 [Mycena capillaripes]